MNLRDVADERYRDWRRTSGHSIIGSYVPYVDGYGDGYRDGHAAANNGPKVVELVIPNKGGQDCANSLPLATEEGNSW